jgi:hypothetical protein
MLTKGVNTMKNLLAASALLALVAVVGCDKGGSTPGGPGVTRSDSGRNMMSEADGTFSMSMSSSSMTIKQGETKSVTITLKRGKNFGEDVQLKFEGGPKGVTFEPASPTIMSSDKEVQVKVAAADDAALGEFTVKVSGQPAKGPAATHDFKITVEKK